MPISLVWTISLLNYDERSKIVVPKDIGKPKSLNKLTGAALGRVPWVPVNPWISTTYAIRGAVRYLKGGVWPKY